MARSRSPRSFPGRKHVPFNRRLRLLAIILGLIFSLFLVRAGYICMVKGERLQELSQRNFLFPRPIPALRGMIYDRNQTPLSTHRLSFSLALSPFHLTREQIESSLDTLSELLGEDFSASRAKLQRLQPSWQQLTLGSRFSLAQVSPALERESLIPGLSVQSGFDRCYLFPLPFSHPLGYVGNIPPAQLESLTLQGYSRNDEIGLLGLEKYYEAVLRGTPGEEILSRSARGIVFDSWVSTPPIPGHNLITTLDHRLQLLAYELLEQRPGIIILMDPRNGEVLTLLSVPGFDPHHSQELAEHSYFDKAVRGHYPIGSLIKPLLALALQSAGVDARDTFYCRGAFFLPNWNRPFRCHYERGHRRVDLTHAIKYSCNIYFYQAALKAGGPALVEFLSRLRLTEMTNIDLPLEATGSMPWNNPGVLKRGALLHFSIGQRFIQLTPLQILRAYCGLATRGYLPTPHLVKAVTNAEGTVLRELKPMGDNITLNPQHLEVVLQAMRAVVNEQGGTAYERGFQPPWGVAGKTGTVQKDEGEPDAWFVGFAPVSQPRIAVLVMVAGAGEGGRVAAPLAARLLEEYFHLYPEPG